MQRIAKAISAAGYCSRREAEKLILSGAVKIDGDLIISPAINVSEDSKIEISGEIIKQKQKPRLWTYYKPLGLITTHSDPQGRETVFDNLAGLPRVISIGRLDLNSEGLLLLTNNGDLARKFELPISKIERVYKVRAYGDENKLLSYLEKVNGNDYISLQIREQTSDASKNVITYTIKSIKLLQSTRTNSWFEVTLTEGKNREIRKIFEHFNLKVNRLIRIKYGSFSLGDLKPNEYKEQSFEKFKDFI